MPVTVVVGGQFGSEGKGKVAHYWAKEKGARISVRVGGTNSGHTVVEGDLSNTLRQLPVGCLVPGTVSVLPAGSYLDLDLLAQEIDRYGLNPETLVIDENAVVITDAEKEAERKLSLQSSIGSTESGTGAAVVARIERKGDAVLAGAVEKLQPFIRKSRTYLRHRLDAGERVLIEGTQGFGLSVLQTDSYPFATSRDTSAAGFVMEAGLSPTDVDEIVLVIRAFPIRVMGNSGPLPNEISWEEVTQISGSSEEIFERTSATGRERRVAKFDPTVVRAALEAHHDATIVLNHLDYVDARCRDRTTVTEKAARFVHEVESQIDARISYFGFSPESVVENCGAPNKLRAV